MKSYLKHIFCTVLFYIFCGLTTHVSAQYNIPKKPSFIPPVIDSTKVLNSSEYKNLYNKLKNYSDSTSTEIIVVIIPTTFGENIGLLTPKWGQKWGIGQAKEDNGVFILLAKNDRKIWISPGYGVEDRLTAGTVGEITRNIIIPEFNKGSYYNGLDKGTDAIFDVLSGKYQRKTTNSTNDFPFVIFILLLIVFIILIIAISKNRRGGNRGNRSSSRSLLDAIILSNMGRGSYSRGSSSGRFGGSSSGGGGFGGFGGGGGFSGGGAGGGW